MPSCVISTRKGDYVKDVYNFSEYLHFSQIYTNLPNIFLSDNGQLIPINRGKNNKIVYNYHFVGRSLWLNKLLLPTSYTVEQENKIDFDSVDIDFSKYSLEDAVDFSKTFFRLSRELDNIAQVKQMVGEYLTIGILTTNGNVVLKSYNADL